MLFRSTAEELDVILGRGVGGDDLPVEAIRHVPFDVVGVAGDDASPRVVGAPFGNPLLLFFPDGANTPPPSSG